MVWSGNALGMDLLLRNMQLFTYKMLTDGLESCGLLWYVYQLLWYVHQPLILTAPIHSRSFIVEQVLINKQTHFYILDVLKVNVFLAHLYFWVNYSYKFDTWIDQKRIVYAHSINKEFPLSPGCRSVSFCGSSPSWRFVIWPLMLWVMMTWATGKPSSFTVPGGEEVPQEAAETIPVSNTPVHVPAILLVVVVLLVIVGDPTTGNIGGLYHWP